MSKFKVFLDRDKYIVIEGNKIVYVKDNTIKVDGVAVGLPLAKIERVEEIREQEFKIGDAIKGESESGDIVEGIILSITYDSEYNAAKCIISAELPIKGKTTMNVIPKTIIQFRNELDGIYVSSASVKPLSMF